MVVPSTVAVSLARPNWVDGGVVMAQVYTIVGMANICNRNVTVADLCASEITKLTCAAA